MLNLNNTLLIVEESNITDRKVVDRITLLIVQTPNVTYTL